MRYYRLTGDDGEPRLAVEVEDEVLHDLTSIDEDLTEIDQLASAASLSGSAIDDLARTLLDAGEADTHDLSQLLDGSRDGTGEFWLDRPFDPPEVWAAGVTYRTSEMERRRESDTPDVYSKVYAAERPEIFFKATPDRCMGPFESIGIRGDSDWNVPEPELAFVVYKGEIIGYTAGNDVSSRSIEGENPLYLPQAKLYANSCAIGPCFVTADAIGDPHSLDIECAILRDDRDTVQRQDVDVGHVPQMRRALGLAPPPQRHTQHDDRAHRHGHRPAARSHAPGRRRRPDNDSQDRPAGERRSRSLRVSRGGPEPGCG